MGCGLIMYRNVGEVFSQNPLHLGIQNAMDGKIQLLKAFQEKLLTAVFCHPWHFDKPAKARRCIIIAFISRKFGIDHIGVDPCSHS